MGRIRNGLRFVISIGGTDGISPIAKESERTKLLREQNELLQNMRPRKSRPDPRFSEPFSS